MKSSLHSSHSYLKTAVLIMPLAFLFQNPASARPGETDCSNSGSGHQTGVAQGYLIVYSATDQLLDGGVPYNLHSSYLIYSTEGKLLKSVENHLSPSDETPALVTLPVGSYAIEARSENRGYIRVPIVITAGHRTVVEPENEQSETRRQLIRARQSRRPTGGGWAKN